MFCDRPVKAVLENDLATVPSHLALLYLMTQTCKTESQPIATRKTRNL